MAKGQIVTAEVENLVVKMYRAHHGKWKAPRVRNEVESELRDRAVKNHKSIPDERFPSLSTVQKILAVERKPGSKEDEPWDISTLGKYPIPPEAVPIVLDVSIESEQPFTIREAKWLGFLYKLLIMVTSQQGQAASVSFFGGIAKFYATTERIAELTGKKSPSIMDKILCDFLTKRETLELAFEAYEREFQPGMKDSRWRMDESGTLSFMLTKEELNRTEKVGRKLGHSRPFKGSIKETSGITLEVKESIDERTSGQSQSTKAKGHRKHPAVRQG